MIDCRRNGETPLAFFKSANQGRIVRIVSAFHNKDLLVPIPPEDLSHLKTLPVKQEYPGPKEKDLHVYILVGNIIRKYFAEYLDWIITFLISRIRCTLSEELILWNFFSTYWII